MDDFVDSLYVPNYQNKVVPVDRIALADTQQGMSVEEVGYSLFRALEMAQTSLYEDVGCEHKTNFLLNQLVTFTLSARELLIRGLTLHVYTDADYYLGQFELHLWSPEEIRVTSSQTVGMWAEALGIEIDLLPDDFRVEYLLP